MHTEKAEEVPNVRYVAADVTDEAEMRATSGMISSTQPPLRLVANCAGIAPAARVLSSRGAHDLDLFRKTLEVNLLGTSTSCDSHQNSSPSKPADGNGQRRVPAPSFYVIVWAAIIPLHGLLIAAHYAGTP